jgi:hypothetical protein
LSALAETVRVEPWSARLLKWNRTPFLRGGSLAVSVIALGAGAVLGEPQAIAIAVLGLTLGLALVWFCFRAGEREFLLTLFLVAFGVRVVGAIVSHFVLIYSGRGGFLLLDDRAYDKLGWTLARFWMGLFPGIRDTDQYLMVNYTYLVGAVYYILGHALLAAKMINVAFGALTGIVAYALGSEIFNKPAGRISAILTAFFPSLLVWSVINLKDTLAVLVTLGIVFGLVRFARRHEWWALGLTLAFLFYVENLRPQVFFILTWLLPVAFFFTDRSQWVRKLFLAIPLVVGVLALNVYTHNRAGLNWLTPQALSQAEWARYVAAREAETGIEDNADKPTKELGGILERNLTYLPKGAFYVLLGPTPWEARSALARAVIPEMLAWYCLLAAALVGLAVTFRQSWRDLVLPGSFAAAWVFALALYEGNTGNIFRHRSQFMPFIFLVSAVGLQWLWARWRARNRVAVILATRN